MPSSLSAAATSSAQDLALASGDTSASLRFYDGARWFITRILWRYFRVNVLGREKLSHPGSVLIAPIHRSNLDAPLINAGSSRRIRSLAKQSLFKGKALAWIMAALGGFPVERGTADRGALRAARLLLDKGDPLLVFPEGTRQSGRTVGEMFDGVAYLAAKTGAPVIPIAIAGSEEAMPSGAKFPRRGHVTIVVGDAIEAPANPKGRVTVGDRERYSAALHTELQGLLDQAFADRDARAAAN